MSAKLPSGWSEMTSTKTGKTYYLNEKTKQSQWEFPSGDTVKCCHLLVKHVESRRPSSWRQEKIIRTKIEAMETIKNYLEAIKRNPDTFKDYASEFSDCSSAKNGGDLGGFGKGEMQQSFEDVAFSLKIGEISEIVDSGSGLHIIYRYG